VMTFTSVWKTPSAMTVWCSQPPPMMPAWCPSWKTSSTT